LPEVDSLTDLLFSSSDSVCRNSTYTGFRTEVTSASFAAEHVILHNAYVIFDEFDDVLVLNEKFQLYASFYPKEFWYHRYINTESSLNVSHEKLQNAIPVSGTNFILSNTVVSNNLFHLIIDNYSRLLYYNNLFSENNVTAIFPIGREQSKDQMEFHNVFTSGIKNKFLERGIYRFEKLLIPPMSFIRDYLISDPFLFARDKIRSHFSKKEKKHPTRLYISRADTVVRNLSNEAALIDALRPLGFTPICAGDFSIHTQLELCLF
jgi:capsular polysaccharide biosynthesis protein